MAFHFSFVRQLEDLFFSFIILLRQHIYYRGCNINYKFTTSFDIAAIISWRHNLPPASAHLLVIVSLENGNNFVAGLHQYSFLWGLLVKCNVIKSNKILTLRCQIWLVIFLALCGLWMLNNVLFILCLAGRCRVWVFLPVCDTALCSFFSAVYSTVTCGSIMFLFFSVVLF